MKSNYVKKREFVIDKITSLTQSVYPDDRRMLSDVIDRTVELKVAETNEDFVNGMLGFIKYCNDEQEKDSSLLNTLIHDLGEFCRNRNKDWFSPRTTSYATIYNEDVLLSLAIDESILKEDIMQLRDTLEKIHNSKNVVEGHEDFGSEIKEVHEPTLREIMKDVLGLSDDMFSNIKYDLVVLRNFSIEQWLINNHDGFDMSKYIVWQDESSKLYEREVFIIPKAYVEYHYTSSMREAIKKAEK